MRSMPSTFGDVREQQREVGDLAVVRSSPAVGVHVLAEQRDFPHALRGEVGALRRARRRTAARLPRRACRARRRSVQYLLQPSMIETKAVAPSTRAGGRWSNFSISGKEMSTCGAPRRAPRARSARGRRCRVCGPNTRSTYGARATIASPSWLATQPPTPISSVGPRLLEGAHAAEVGEHLLLRLLAHRAGVEEDDVGVLGRGRSSRSRRRRRARRPSCPSRTRSSGSRRCG